MEDGKKIAIADLRETICQAAEAMDGLIEKINRTIMLPGNRIEVRLFVHGALGVNQDIVPVVLLDSDWSSDYRGREEYIEEIDLAPLKPHLMTPDELRAMARLQEAMNAWHIGEGELPTQETVKQ